MIDDVTKYVFTDNSVWHFTQEWFEDWPNNLSKKKFFNQYVSFVFTKKIKCEYLHKTGFTKDLMRLFMSAWFLRQQQKIECIF